MPTKKEAIAVLRELLESGTLTPIIDSTFPLSEVREAFRHMIEDETRGKVILTPAERNRQMEVHSHLPKEGAGDPQVARTAHPVGHPYRRAD